jgi:hypothetical protein
MTVLASYSSFRHHFAEVGRTTSVSLTYVSGSPATITRGSGSFVTDGHVAGMSIDVANTVSNDGRYTIDTVAALTITLSDDDSLTNEGPVTSSLLSANYYTDGYEEWPRDNVRAGGFSDTWSLSIRPATVYPNQLTVNANATDVDAGSSYTWYVRQRTDDASLQWLSISHANPLATGTVTIALTAAAVTALGIATAGTKLTADQQRRVLRNVWVFCKRNSDGAIQQQDLLQFSHGTVL